MYKICHRFRLRLVAVNSFHIVSATGLYHYASGGFQRKHIVYKTQVEINGKTYFVFTLESASFCRYKKKKKRRKEISQWLAYLPRMTTKFAHTSASARFKGHLGQGRIQQRVRGKGRGCWGAAYTNIYVHTGSRVCSRHTFAKYKKRLHGWFM